MESQSFDYVNIMRKKQEIDEHEYIGEMFPIFFASRSYALDILRDNELTEEFLNEFDEDNAEDFATTIASYMSTFIAEEVFGIDGEFESLMDAYLSLRKFGSKGNIAISLVKFLWEEVYHMYMAFENSDLDDISNDSFFG